MRRKQGRGGQRGRRGRREFLRREDHRRRRADAAAQQPRPQPFAAAVQSLGQRPFRPAQLAGGLFVRLAFQVAQHQRRPQLGRQPLKLLVQHAAQLPRRRLLGGIGVGERPARRRLIPQQSVGPRRPLARPAEPRAVPCRAASRPATRATEPPAPAAPAPKTSPGRRPPRRARRRGCGGRRPGPSARAAAPAPKTRLPPAGP